MHDPGNDCTASAPVPALCLVPLCLVPAAMALGRHMGMGLGLGAGSLGYSSRMAWTRVREWEWVCVGRGRGVGFGTGRGGDRVLVGWYGQVDGRLGLCTSSFGRLLGVAPRYVHMIQCPTLRLWTTSPRQTVTKCGLAWGGECKANFL